MELIPKRAFTSWASRHGISRDPKYKDLQDFNYAGGLDFNRFWLPDPIISNLINFVNAVLITASPTGPFYFYRRAWGTWYYRMVGSVRNVIIDRMIAPLDIPIDFRGALKLGKEEWGNILTIISAHYVFGWSVNEDLFVIPDSADCILMVSHHGQLNGTFPSEKHLTEFIIGMEEKGFQLPNRVPDGTFKIPEWMQRGTATSHPTQYTRLT
jgi:hypothetical protein